MSKWNHVLSMRRSIPVIILGILGLVGSTTAARSSSPALPDAQLVAIDVEGADFHDGDRISLSIRLRNTGEAPLPPVPVVLAIGDEPFSEWKLPSALSPGETAEWPIVWIAKRGPHLIEATVDPLNDAEPGKILHEMRGGEMAALREVPFAQYYGSVDSTALFVLLAGLYVERTGDEETLAELWPAIERALQWIDGPGDPDPVTVVRERVTRADLYDLLKAYADQRNRTAVKVHVVRARVVWSIKDARARLERLVGSMATAGAGEWVQLDLCLERFLPKPEDSRSALAASFGARGLIAIGH